MWQTASIIVAVGSSMMRRSSHWRTAVAAPVRRCSSRRWLGRPGGRHRPPRGWLPGDMGSTPCLSGRRAWLVDRKLVEGAPSGCRLAASVWVRSIGGYAEAPWLAYRLVEASAFVAVREAKVKVIEHPPAPLGGGFPHHRP